MTYTVSARAREFGVRMAVGAPRHRIAWDVVKRALALASVGAGIGVVGAVAATRLLASHVYGVSPLHAGTYLSVVCGLVVLTVVASAIPAFRAGRMDPVTALRAE